MAFGRLQSCKDLCQKSIFRIYSREISTTVCAESKRNFRKFPYMDRGTKEFNERQRTKPDPNLPSFRYGKEPGYWDENHNLVVVPEMVPELIIPDLTGFTLKPYVSFRVPDFEEPAFTAKDLFYSVYAEKIEADFKENKLNEDGLPLEPSEEELLTAEQARENALKLNADMFTDTENIINDSEWMKEQPKLDYN